MSHTDTITVLSDIEKIRQRPGMYIGDNDRLGMNTIVREILDNAVDEYPNFPDKTKPIIVTVGKDNVVTVRDHGRGISPYQSKKQKGKIEERLAYTLIGAGGKFREDREKNGNRFAGGLNGSGACCTNAMSEFFHVDIWKDGYHFSDHYAEAIPTTELKDGNLPKEKLSTPETGTQISFKASKKYMRTVKVDVNQLMTEMQQAAYLHPGLHIQFTNERDEEDTMEFYSENGLLDYMNEIGVDENGNPVSYLIKPFFIHGNAEAEVMGQVNKMEANIAVAFARGESSAAKTFTNGVENSSGGTHLQGFYQGLVELLRHYYEEFQSDFQSKYKVQLELIRKVNNLSSTSEIFSLVKPRSMAKKTYVIIDFKHDDPILKPQTKDELASPEAKPAVAKIFYEKASIYLDKNVAAVHELIEFLIRDLYEKAKEEDSSINITKNEIKQIISSKLAAAKSKNAKEKEMFIVEGDSAAGSLKENRDSNFQAVLPLRGKVLNAKKTTLAKLLANQEIATFVMALGTGIGSKYDESKLAYDRIIITTDQDVDGDHIATLLITFIMTYMPDLIRNGHVYILDTPLYVNVMKTKNEEIYTYSEEEQLEFVEKNRSKIAEIQRNKGLGELTKAQVIKTILTPETRRLTKLTLTEEDTMYNVLEQLMGKDVQGRKQLFVNGVHADMDDVDADVDLSGWFKSHFYSYGISVIEDRALPDVRDGLKPVYRAIMYELLKSGTTSKAKPTKVARIAGNVIGNWHPHGDKAVEDALTGIAQPWTNNLPAIQIKGNGGSIFGDSAAAGRYIEARLTPAGDAYGYKLKDGIVPYVPNFDDTGMMPTILPAQLPYLLINGIKEGIAVGVAASVPPHNPREVLEMTIAYLKKPKIKTEELLSYMPGPDFPSGATIINKDDLLEIYRKGEGKIMVRATLEYDKKEHAIHVREIPYSFAGSMDNLVAELVQATTESVDSKKKKVPPKITGVAQVNNYSGKDGIDICIELQRGVDPNEMMKTLYAKTRLETSIKYMFNALNAKTLHQYSLRQYLAEYTDFQHEIVLNEHKLEEKDLSNRLEIIKGRIIASSFIDEIVDVVKHSNGRSQLKDVLMNGTILEGTNKKYHKAVSTFAFTELQAEAISGMMLYQLNKLDVEKLKQEGTEIQKRLLEVQRVINDEKYRHKLIIKRLEAELKKMPECPRHTTIISDSVSKASELEIPLAPYYVAMDKYGYVRIEGKAFDDSIATDNKSRLGFFDAEGNCWNVFLDKIKETKDRGTLISRLIPTENQIVGFTATIDKEDTEGLFIFENGNMKRTSMNAYLTKTHATKIKSRTESQPLKAFYDIPKDCNIVVVDGKEIPLSAISSQGLSGSGKNFLTPKEEPYDVTFKQGDVPKEVAPVGKDVFDAVVTFTADGKLLFDWTTLDKTGKEGLYVTTYQELIKETLLFVHSDGTAKKVSGDQFIVKTKRTQIDANKKGVEAIYIGPVNEKTLIGNYEDGKQKRIDVSQISVQGKVGGGMRVFYSNKYKFIGIEPGDNSDLPIVSFATQPK